MTITTVARIHHKVCDPARNIMWCESIPLLDQYHGRERVDARVLSTIGNHITLSISPNLEIAWNINLSLRKEKQALGSKV